MSEYIPNLKPPKAGWQRMEFFTQEEAKKIRQSQDMADKEAQTRRQRIKRGIDDRLEQKALDDEFKEVWE